MRLGMGQHLSRKAQHWAPFQRLAAEAEQRLPPDVAPYYFAQLK